MLTSSVSSQFIHPDYLQPLPTTVSFLIRFFIQIFFLIFPFLMFTYFTLKIKPLSDYYYNTGSPLSIKPTNSQQFIDCFVKKRMTICKFYTSHN